MVNITEYRAIKGLIRVQNNGSEEGHVSWRLGVKMILRSATSSVTASVKVSGSQSMVISCNMFIILVNESAGRSVVTCEWRICFIYTHIYVLLY